MYDLLSKNIEIRLDTFFIFVFLYVFALLMLEEQEYTELCIYYDNDEILLNPVVVMNKFNDLII